MSPLVDQLLGRAAGWRSAGWTMRHQARSARLNAWKTCVVLHPYGNRGHSPATALRVLPPFVGSSRSTWSL